MISIQKKSMAVFIFLVQLILFCFITASTSADNLEFSVVTGKGAPVTGASIYAYTEAGAYTGVNTTTNSSGTAIFDTASFQTGSYKFRADYLGVQFWSDIIPLPETLTASLTIPDETASVTVTTSAGASQSVKVYLYTGTGAYLGINKTTDTNGEVAFDLPIGSAYKFRADILSNQYWSSITTIQQGTNNIPVNAGGGVMDVTVQKSAGTPMSGLQTYLYNASGTYLGITKTTSGSGAVQFSVPAGNYKVRADYLGYQYWSAQTNVTADTGIPIEIPHQDSIITVQGGYQGSSASIAGINVYLFTSSGTFMGQTRSTDANGQVTFSLPQNSYKVRADYMSQQFWSGNFTWQNSSVDIPMSDAEVTVTGMGLPLENVNVYLYTGSGTYLGITKSTNSSGKATFRTPSGPHKFRADYQASQYWSNTATLVADQVNPVAISTGGGLFSFSVTKNSAPLTGVNCYLFTESGTYLGLNKITDSNGAVSFSLANGNYKVRVDYLGYQYWSGVYSVPTTLSGSLDIPHQDVVITVHDSYQSTQNPVQGANVYLFTSSGTYMGQTRATDANGQVTFNLPQNSYKVRADFMSQQFWSDNFTWQDSSVNIPMADAEVTVTGIGQPLENVNVYLFTGTGTYLGINKATDSSGKTTFRTPSGPHKFRADYMGSQYWSNVETLIADQVTPVAISTGGGIFNFSVTANSTPLAGVNCYLFTESGTYLGLNKTTDSNGAVSFPLSNGNYKIRVDYLGNQFWSGVYTAPDTLTGSLNIPHQDVVITVQDSYQGTQTPLQGVSVYLFTSTGTYMGKNLTTDINGQVTFNLPEKAYKVRADYMGQQFWLGDFTWQDSTITIPKGTAHVHVTRLGVDLEGAVVYLFTGSGSYLGLSQTTTSSGLVEFLIPAGTYNFRVNETGDQRWSGESAINPEQMTSIRVEMNDTLPPTVSFNADPENIGEGESAILAWTSTNADTVFINRDIGVVNPNGSITVSPTETTEYTITAEGPNGSITATITVTVIVDTIAPTVTAIPAGGSYNTPQKITLIANEASTIYYTIDGSEPTMVSNLYLDPISISADATLKAIAIDSAGNQSTTITEEYIITSNNITSIRIIEPDGVDDIATTSYTITWEDNVPDNNAQISLYYDTDNSGEDGTLIVSGLNEDDDGVGDQYVWDISGLPNGYYYIYAVIDDGVNTPIVEYSQGRVIVNHFVYDEIKFTSAEVMEGELFGYSVDISGDNAVIGKFGEYGYNGKAFIYKRNGLNWHQEARLSTINSNNNTNILFGCSVSMSGDYAIVGAFFDSDDDGARTGSAYIFNRSESVWNEQNKLMASDKNDWLSFGRSVSMDGDYAIVGAENDEENGSNSGAAYIFKREGNLWIEKEKLLPSDGDAGDLFGYSVSINGDYAVIGAYGAYDGNNNISGAAYIFKRENDLWIEKEKLLPSDTGGGFGYSVSIKGDHVVIGAPFYDSDRGSSYIFKREGADWIEIKKIIAYDGFPEDQFGRAVDISDKYIIVGSPFDDVNGDESGSAYVIIREDEKWDKIVKIIGSKTSVGNNFGCSVAINDNYAIIGAERDNENGRMSGAAYIYLIGPGTIHANSEYIPIAGSTTLSWNYFGATSVSIDNGIGSVAAVGSVNISPAETITYTITTEGPWGTYTRSITVYVCEPPTINIMEPSYSNFDTGMISIKWSDSAQYPNALISLYYDTDNSGADGTLIKNGLDEDPDGIRDEYIWNSRTTPKGNYYIYAVIDDGVNEPVISYSTGTIAIRHIEHKFISTESLNDIYFGNSVAINEPYAIVGAFSYNNESDPRVGAVYIYKQDEETWNRIKKLTASDARAFDEFGWSVASSGEYLIVGAPARGNKPGSAYIFKNEGDSWNEITKLTGRDDYGSDEFGYSVAIDGNYVVIGAPSDNFVYIYKRNKKVWSEVAKLTPPEGTGGCFGNSVSISGDYVMASTSICSTYDSGKVLIYKREGDLWNNISTLTASDQVYEDGFGSSLSISGNYAVVGAPGSYYNPSGSAYVFKRDGEIWSEITKLTATDLADRTLFGKSVDISSDTIVVGSQGPNSIHVYKLKNNIWNETYKFYPSYPEEGENVNSVAVSESYALVGAADPSTWSGKGAAYIYSITPGTLSTESNIIVAGDSTTLSWSYPGVTSVFINGIHYDSAEGSIPISPTETTTYTITAQGPWGTDTRNITVSVFNPPSVTLNASASSIIEGNSIILTWESTTAEEVIIEPGNISVEANGSLILFPSETTTYQITARNPASEATANVTVEVIKRITITSPLNGDVINSPDILVEGTLYNPSGQELGVVVNGVIASVDDNQFTANHVPLEDGDNEIVVTCTTASGGTATASITVNADTTVDYIKITPDDESGVAPFETTLRLDASFAITEEPEITYTGPGVLDILKIEDENNYTITTSTPGLYFITAEVENYGSIYTDTIAILVMDETMLDTKLKAKWNGMKQALLGNNTQEAATYFRKNKRNSYNEFLQLIPNNKVNDLIPGLERMKLLGVTAYGARFVADIDIIVNGEEMTIGSYIDFAQDDDGIWRISFF